MSNSSVWPTDRTQPDTNMPGQSGTGSNGNKRVLCIHQSSKTVASPSDDFVSYLGY